MHKLSILMASFLLILAPAVQAQSVDRSSGSVTARSYEPFQTGSTITVVKADDTDQYERLKTAIESALRARGYRVADDGQFVLEFYASEVLGNGTVERPNGGALASQSAVPLSPERSGSMGLLSGINQRLFGENQTLGPEARESEGRPVYRQVHLSMTLTDQKAARRLWQGTAAGDLRRADSFAATQSLVPFLVRYVGRTANGEKFDLP